MESMHKTDHRNGAAVAPSAAMDSPAQYLDEARSFLDRIVDIDREYGQSGTVPHAVYERSAERIARSMHAVRQAQRKAVAATR